MQRGFLYATSFLAGLTVIGTQPASAQQAAQTGGRIEEIIVTARRKEENLMTVPMSIAALTADDIQAAGVKDLNTLSLYTPGLWAEYGVSGPGSNMRQLTFRGLSVSSGLVFIDGAPYAGTGTPSLGSVERVEVLVGPQSVYFGRSTFSGAVNFVTKDPGDSFSGQFNAEYAKFGTTDDSVILEGPLVSDKLGARVTFRHYSTAGQWPNFSDPSEILGSSSQDSVLATFVAKPTDNLKFKVLLGYEDENINGSPRTISLYGNDRNPGAVQSLFCNLGGTFGPYWCGALPTAKQIPASFISANDVITPAMQAVLFGNPLGWPTLFSRTFKNRFGQRLLSEIGHLNIDYTMPSGWDVATISAFHKTKSQSIAAQHFRDGRYTVNPFFGRVPLVLPYLGFYLVGQNLLYDSSQELRITSPQDERLRGTFGTNWVYTRTPGGVQSGYQPGVVAVSGSQTRVVTSTPAVYGGLYYDIVDKVTLGVEARYQSDKITATVKYPTLGAPLFSTYKSFSPRVTLDYKYTENSLAYVLWSRGYRPGGFNSTLVGQPQSVLTQLALTGAGISFAQEKLDNFEAGLKSTWLDGHLQTRIDAYYETWRNGQITQTVNALAPNGSVFLANLIVNIGAVNLHGIEFTGTAAINEQFSVATNFNWQASKITRYVSLITARINNSTNVNGKTFPRAPNLTWTVSPTYTDHLSGDWDWYSRLDWKHRGKYYVDVSNVAWLVPSDIVDLRLGVKDQNKKIEVYGTNLTNNMQFLTASQGNDSLCCSTGSTVNGIHLALPDKRSYGIKGTYSF